MLREDFVSNSSSCSFVFSFTKKDYDRLMERPHTILDAVVKKLSKWGYEELPEPVDKRKDHCRMYDWKGNKRTFDWNKFEWLICPYREYYIDRESLCTYDLNTVNQYLECCKCCDSKTEDGRDCCDYHELLKIQKELKKKKVVMKFRLDDCGDITSHDLNHDTQKDKRRIIFVDEH